MMRSLWTAASGMNAQQLNIDTISNNLSNVSTYGYKKERLEFSSLLYDTMKRADLDPANQKGRPVNLQVGSGVRPVASARMFTMGNMQRTDHKLDLTITGDGFFAVRTSTLEDDQLKIGYTKDGAFKTSPTDEGLMIVTDLGQPLLGIDDEPIYLPDNILLSSLTISPEGVFTYINATGETEDLDYQIDINQFANIQGLEAIGGNSFHPTVASGPAIKESDGEISKRSAIMQGVLEMSNVQVADEMVNLIVAQRAYELNSKAIQTSDSMLQEANNIKRN